MNVWKTPDEVLACTPAAWKGYDASGFGEEKTTKAFTKALPRLPAAAPHPEVLCLSLGAFGLLVDTLTIVQPLQHAVRLQHLWPHPDAEEQMIAAARLLTQPTAGHSNSGDGSTGSADGIGSGGSVFSPF